MVLSDLTSEKSDVKIRKKYRKSDLTLKDRLLMTDELVMTDSLLLS